MRFASIIAGMPDLPACRLEGWSRAAALDVTGITADSREVRPGMIFAALPGVKADGRAFIADAIARGASAVLAAPGTDLPSATPLLADELPRRRLARIAALLAPPQPECLVAVTGTNGKTSTTDFLRQIWARAGRRAACLGTLGVVTEAGADGPTLDVASQLRDLW